TLLRPVRGQLHNLPSVLEASERRRLAVGLEVEDGLNRPELLELGRKHPCAVTLLVQVQHDDALALLGKMPSNVASEGRFTDPASLVRDYDRSHCLSPRRVASVIPVAFVAILA